MVRRKHADGWKPGPRQAYYFSRWDVCPNCRHTQHYEAFKVTVGDTRNHPNGAPMFAPDGMMLDEYGQRSIFDDVDK